MLLFLQCGVVPTIELSENCHTKNINPIQDQGVAVAGISILATCLEIWSQATRMEAPLGRHFNMLESTVSLASIYRRVG